MHNLVGSAGPCGDMIFALLISRTCGRGATATETPVFPLHARFPEELQRRLAVPCLDDEGLQNLALVVDGPPEVERGRPGV